MQPLIDLFKKEKLHGKIGLALGSGSARGLAHIGVIKALQELGIKPDVVAGTSIGALVGAAYVTGSLNRLEAFMTSLTWKKILSYVDLMVPQYAFMEGDKIMSVMNELYGNADFSDCKVPFATVSCDVHSGEEVVLKSGPLDDAVRASISLPAIFEPVEWEKRYLVDGGLVNPVPVSVVREMGADTVIAVDLNSDVLEANIRIREETGDKNGKPNILNSIAYTIDIMVYKLTQIRLEAEKPDLLIEPEVGHIGLFDYHLAKPAIKEGYRVATEAVTSSRS